jgi:hypothetical protein
MLRGTNKVYLVGEFRGHGDVTSAILSLKAVGLTDDDLALFSEEPVELRRGVLDRPSRISLMSVLGAIVFGSLATGFIYFAQHNYQLITGGMPTFSFWATGVITYEMTMLGAILATFLWFLWESGLLRKRDRNAPIPEVSPGSICLRVNCGRDAVGRASDLMRRAGAIHVNRQEEA